MVPRVLSALVVVLALVVSACAPARDDTEKRAVRRQKRAVQPSPTVTQAPPAPGVMRFAVLGDFGTGFSDQAEVARRMCRWRRDHPFRLVITTGDNIYPDGHPDHFDDKFFEPYACLLNNGVRFRASLGNHDVVTDNGRPELEEPAFGMRGRNYVIRSGGVRFVIADSNVLDKEWLRTALNPRSGDRWTIVAFHHPVFSPGTHGSTHGFRPDLPRMFRRKGVDLVLNGHDHLYAVTKPINRIRYVVTGGGGAGLYDCHSRWFTARCRERHHFLYVTVKAGRLVVQAMPETGDRIHRFVTRGRS